MSYQNGDITVLELKSGKVTRLTSSLDRSVQQFEWNSNSDGLVFSYLDHGQTRLAEVNLKGKITTLKATLGGQSLGLSLIHISEPTRPY